MQKKFPYGGDLPSDFKEEAPFCSTKKKGRKIAAGGCLGGLFFTTATATYMAKIGVPAGFFISGLSSSFVTGGCLGAVCCCVACKCVPCCCPEKQAEETPLLNQPPTGYTMQK